MASNGFAFFFLSLSLCLLFLRSSRGAAGRLLVGASQLSYPKPPQVMCSPRTALLKRLMARGDTGLEPV